jgi:hypothetical protein
MSRLMHLRARSLEDGTLRIDVVEGRRLARVLRQDVCDRDRRKIRCRHAPTCS